MEKARRKTKKRSVRFPPDPGTLAVVTISTSDEVPRALFGLVLNESFTGCAVVLMTNLVVKEDMKCKCRIGELGEVKATVRWAKMLDQELVKVGLEYAL